MWKQLSAGPARLTKHPPGDIFGSATLDNPHDIGNCPSPPPRGVQLAMVAVFGVGFAASALLAASEHWRRATFTLGAAMVWLGVVRLSCDSKQIGVLAVRSRRFDTMFCAGLGAAMMWLAYSVDALGS